ncbi:MAG: AIPR family protein [Candidatus Aenigmatarchaeota archaeon]
MEYKNTDELIRSISSSSQQNKVEATKELTKYYARARFKINPEEFDHKYTDGRDDGGIDFYHQEDNTFFIFQTKFSENPKKVSTSEILDEIRKLKNTLTASNPNKKADEFVNSLKRETGNKDAILEVVWLTTNIVERSVRNEIQKDLELWRKEKGWVMEIDFVAIDKYDLDRVIYDVAHGYIPYTGKKILKMRQRQWMESTPEETGIHSVVCTVNINDILKWFHSSDEIDRFLQKNVREFLGESKINRAIAKSYSESPEWFWYKHNGIIIFADYLSIDETKNELTLRNPQVVNGGQTLKALFSEYDKKNMSENPAKVLLRIYQLPYEEAKTYKRSIDIILALNSQNKINPSDLRSTDPRQVRLEQLFKEIRYNYIRKRSKEAKRKNSRYSITMRNLALRYYVCKEGAPHEGVRGNVEGLFEDDNKYDKIFNENKINEELSGNHIVIDYITCWNIDQILQSVKKNIPKRDAEYFQYTKWFVLADIYEKLKEWKRKKSNLDWRLWIDFIESSQFENAVWEYSRYAFKKGREIIPKGEEPRSFFKTKDAFRRFRFKVSRRNFELIMNKALIRFRKNEPH